MTDYNLELFEAAEIGDIKAMQAAIDNGAIDNGAIDNGAIDNGANEHDLDSALHLAAANGWLEAIEFLMSVVFVLLLLCF